MAIAAPRPPAPKTLTRPATTELFAPRAPRANPRPGIITQFYFHNSPESCHDQRISYRSRAQGNSAPGAAQGREFYRRQRPIAQPGTRQRNQQQEKPRQALPQGGKLNAWGQSR